MSIDRPIRIAVLSSLYPNSQQPRHGVFVEQRLRALVSTGDVEARVVAPVPWFFSTQPRFGHYARLAAVPKRERRHGLTIDHPRYPVIPKIGMTLGPAAMARGARAALQALRADGFDFDLIDAHYFYPDGVAACRLATYFQRPFAVTSRGSDLNVIAELGVPRRQILAAAHKADALITVSQALARKLEQMGVDSARVTTLRNGVDTVRFAPRDREAARARIGFNAQGPVWLCVGHLLEGKGMHLAIEALPRAPGVTLVLVGDGPDRQKLVAQAQRLGVAERVHFAGTIDHGELPEYYSAADALIFPTYAEGMPNVVLESLACGCAVIATAVGGIPEIMRGPPAGLLLEDRTASAIIRAWQSLQTGGLDVAARARRRRYAEQFSWDATVAGQLKIFRRLADAGRSRDASRGEQRAAGSNSG